MKTALVFELLGLFSRILELSCGYRHEAGDFVSLWHSPVSSWVFPSWPSLPPHPLASPAVLSLLDLRSGLPAALLHSASSALPVSSHRAWFVCAPAIMLCRDMQIILPILMFLLFHFSSGTFQGPGKKPLAFSPAQNQALLAVPVSDPFYLLQLQFCIYLQTLINVDSDKTKLWRAGAVSSFIRLHSWHLAQGLVHSSILMSICWMLAWKFPEGLCLCRLLWEMVKMDEYGPTWLSQSSLTAKRRTRHGTETLSFKSSCKSGLENAWLDRPLSISPKLVNYNVKQCNVCKASSIHKAILL